MVPAARLITTLLGSLLLAGCTTTAPTPASPVVAPASATGTPPVPAPAAPVVILPPATIKGSEESSTLLDNFTAFISAVDGEKIPTGRKGWAQPVTLAAGQRRLTVEFIRGVFFARTELVLEAKPEAAYELRHTSDAQVYGDHTFCEFWIVDLATGEKVTAPKRTGLGKVQL
jgi:hypothetical protein